MSTPLPAQPPVDRPPFTDYLRIIGKGKRGSRSLNREEARDALGQVLDGACCDAQIGAFFVLIRVREETPEEAAGFTDAVRARLAVPPDGPVPDIDWGCYAGKRRHLPWYLLAVKALADQGTRVLLHGNVGPTATRLYTEHALSALGIPLADSLASAQTQLAAERLSYVPLQAFSPTLASLLTLQQTIGLRVPLHSVARMLNPLAAPLSVHGVFHRGFDRIHQQTAVLDGAPAVLAFRGEGGEAEVRPERPVTLCCARHGVASEITLPATGKWARGSVEDPSTLARVWHGEAHEYAEQAVIATLAAVRHGQTGEDAESALAFAKTTWDNRKA
ncbi:MAG: glycosyl transferase family protein [Pseudomonadota bacterium]